MPPPRPWPNLHPPGIFSNSNASSRGARVKFKWDYESRGIRLRKRRGAPPAPGIYKRRSLYKCLKSAEIWRRARPRDCLKFFAPHSVKRGIFTIFNRPHPSATRARHFLLKAPDEKSASARIVAPSPGRVPPLFFYPRINVYIFFHFKQIFFHPSHPLPRALLARRPREVSAERLKYVGIIK